MVPKQKGVVKTAGKSTKLEGVAKKKENAKKRKIIGKAAAVGLGETDLMALQTQVKRKNSIEKQKPVMPKLGMKPGMAKQLPKLVKRPLVLAPPKSPGVPVNGGVGKKVKKDLVNEPSNNAPQKVKQALKKPAHVPITSKVQKQKKELAKEKLSPEAVKKQTNVVPEQAIPADVGKKQKKVIPQKPITVDVGKKQKTVIHEVKLAAAAGKNQKKAALAADIVKKQQKVLVKETPIATVVKKEKKAITGKTQTVLKRTKKLETEETSVVEGAKKNKKVVTEETSAEGKVKKPPKSVLTQKMPKTPETVQVLPDKAKKQKKVLTEVNIIENAPSKKTIVDEETVQKQKKSTLEVVSKPLEKATSLIKPKLKQNNKASAFPDIEEEVLEKVKPNKGEAQREKPAGLKVFKDRKFKKSRKALVKEKKALELTFELKPFDEDKFNQIVCESNVKKIVEALKIQAATEVQKQKSIFTDYRYILQVTAYKIPNCPRRMVKLDLKHSLISPDDDVALIVIDLQRGARVDYEPTVQHYEDLLAEIGIDRRIKVIPFNQLRNEMGTFEAKRKFLNTYDYFLCDGRISGQAHSFLGTHSQNARNVLHAVHLSKEVPKLKKEIERALCRTAFKQLHKGDLIAIPVGNCEHSTTQLTENIIHLSKNLAKFYPGGLPNVRSMHIKINIPGSSALPLYISMCAPPADTPYVVGPREQRMLKLKKEANAVLQKFALTKEANFVKLTDEQVKNKLELRRKREELLAAEKETEENELAPPPKKKSKNAINGALDVESKNQKKLLDKIVEEVDSKKLMKNQTQEDDEDDDESDEEDEDESDDLEEDDGTDDDDDDESDE